MIKPITIYTAICDSCGENICDGTGFSGWCMDGIEYELSEQDWITLEKTHEHVIGIFMNGDKTVAMLDKHYCPKCYEYDENDKLILPEIK